MKSDEISDKVLVEDCGTRALIVEDDESARLMWATIIRKIEPQTKFLFATSMEQAVSILEANKAASNSIDLIVSDFYLNGPQTGMDLWKTARVFKIPFLLSSALAPGQIRKICSTENEWPAFVEKNSSITDLWKKMGQLLRKAG